MNKVLNNGVNNNRGTVVIAKSETNKLANFTGINREIHAAMVRKTLRDTLYSWSPIYRMITINGTNEDNDLLYNVQNVVGGNSPVARAFVKKNTEAKDMTVIQFDEKGMPLFRKITTGDSNSRIRYDYTDEIVLIRFSNDMQTIGSMSSEEIVESIISQGLTIDKDRVVVGKADEGTHIDALIWTPSNERNGQILFTSLDPNEAWDKLEAIGGGSISRKLAGKMPVAKFKKLASRLGLFATPAVEFTQVGTENHGLLVLDHELLSTEDFNNIGKEILAKIGVEIDAKQWDGAAFFSAELALDGLKNLGMNRIDIKKALMFAFQLRISQVYAKVFGEALHQSVLNKMSRYIIQELDKIEATTGKKLYRIYGNENCISMILDGNAAKIVDLDQDAKEEGMTVYLLDIAKGSESGTATQMTDKFAIFNKEATAEFLFNRGKKDCLDYAKSIGDNDCSLLGEDINVWQTLLNIGKSAPADSKIAFDVFSDQYIVSKLLKDTSKKHEAAYKKGRVSIASEFERALFDSTYLLTDGAINSILKVTELGAIECYSTDVLERFAEEIEAIETNDNLSDIEKTAKLDEILTGAVIKYPTPGREEIELVRFKTEREIRATIMTYVNNGVIDQATARLVFNYFSFTSYGTIKIAADNALKHKLAGMDTDYDGVVVILEKALIDILVDVYAKRKVALEESTGLIASHAGTIPFIDAAKDCVNFFGLDDDDIIVNDETDISSLNLIGDTTTFGELFK